METLEKSRVCRLCGKHAGNTVDIFDKRGNHVKKINAVLPILVHEMDLLPKHICHPCNCKLQEFHKFYENCLKTDSNLKGQLSWMRGSLDREKIGVPMVQINNFMIKTEPPDYDDQETTETFLHSENYINYIKNAYPDRIFPSNGTKCSRCGCYCGNRNRLIELGKSDAKTRPIRHSVEKNNNNGQFNPRETIRRNLFATEIFGDKNPRIQTVIPVCNISRKTIDNEESNTINSIMKLDRFGGQQNADEVKEKLNMAGETKKMTARTLRPRKTRAINSSHGISAAEVIEKIENKSRSKSINSTESNVFKPVEIKLEVCEDFERSLRPRIEEINYSDSKRKNPLARNDEKRKKASTKIDKKLSNFVEHIAIKIEPKEFTESTISTGKNSRKSRKTKIIFKEYLKNSRIEKIATERNFKTSKSDDFSKEKKNPSRRRNFLENRGNPAPYLRSQRVHLRNGKLKTFESVMEKPKKIQGTYNNAEHCHAFFTTIKRENVKTAHGNFKHRDCDMCKSRFASAELYMLHDCYANKRH